MHVAVSELGIGPRVTPPLPVDPGGAVVDDRLADHLDVDLPLDALDQAHQDVLGLVVRRRAAVGLVAAADRRAQSRGSEPPEPAATVEERAEHGWGVEPGKAEPFDRSVRCDQRARVTVRDESVGGDPREAGLEIGHGRETIWRGWRAR